MFKMKLLDIQAAIGTAILLLSLPCDAKHSHQLQHLEIMGKRHDHNKIHASPRAEGVGEVLKKRATCEFPSNAGLVAVTPGSSNAGWAMSPDQQCTAGSYCPFACPPGQVMAQWNPQATSYVYPLSMDGGCYCDENGQVNKPFPEADYCVDGTGTVSAQNNCGDLIAICQTVLPGNEAMLIPTEVDAGSTVTLAIPGPSYWAGTASHFYVNPPGVSTEDGCVWGDGTNPIGNWAPYVIGGNTVSDGDTFFKIGWNPIYTGSWLSNTLPTFGLKVECSGSGCNGLPCSIDPSVNGLNGVTSSDQASGAGGANFCVVTIPSGQTATVVLFPVGDSGSSSSDSSSHEASSSASPSPTPKLTPASSSSSTSSEMPSSGSSSGSSSLVESSSSSTKSSYIVSLLPSSNVNTTAPTPTAANSPHILFQESNSTSTGSDSNMVATAFGGAAGTAASNSPIASATKKSSASNTLISITLLSFGSIFAIVFTFL